MKRLVLTIAAVALFGLVVQVQAAPITYTLTTTASGTLGTSSFTNATVTITLTGDTSGITAGTGSETGYDFNSGIATVNISGVGTATLTDSIEIASTFDTLFDGVYGVLISDNTTGTGILLQEGAVFDGYGLGPFGPVTGTGGVASGSSMTPIFPTTAGNLTWAIGQPLGTSTFTASPAITAVENAASNITPGLPNAGIAQGSIFIVHGIGLGPANISIATAAFQSTTLSNTSVSITVGGTTVNPPLYYTSASQVAALLPSNTPTGTGTITVSYNGETSAPVPITVVANNLGLFTIDSSGAGPGIVTYSDYSLVSATKATNCGGPNTTCGAANPGDTLILWATGLGPVNGSDASGAGLGQAIDVPLTVWLGGVQAPVSYQGRSGCCIGEDQIVFTVPNNVPTGCAVPLLVQIGNEISNNVLIPVADGGRSCPLVSAAFSLSSDQIESGVAAGPITYGSIRLAHYSDGNGTYEDDAKFQFVKIRTYNPGTQPFFVSWVDSQPPGTCLVYNNLNEAFGPGSVGSIAALDAGSSFSVTGPKGSVSLPVNSGQLSEFNTSGTFLVPGSYTITGTGGADVGSFTATATIPVAPVLVSPVNNGSATRSSGMTVTWTGGSGDVEFEVASPTDNTNTNGATAVCTAPASAGTFTIPPYVLLALPAGNSAGLVLSSGALGSFTATGLNAGTLNTYSNDAGFGFGWNSGGFTFK